MKSKTEGRIAQLVLLIAICLLAALAIESSRHPKPSFGWCFCCRKSMEILRERKFANPLIKRVLVDFYFSQTGRHPMEGGR